MSNARNLANLLGTSTTVPRVKQPAGSVLQMTTNYPDDFKDQFECFRQRIG